MTILYVVIIKQVNVNAEEDLVILCITWSKGLFKMLPLHQLNPSPATQCA